MSRDEHDEGLLAQLEFTAAYLAELAKELDSTSRRLKAIAKAREEREHLQRNKEEGLQDG